MPYDPTLQNLEGLQADVREAAIFLVNAYRQAGYPAIVVSGRRTEAKQRALLLAGRTTATASRHLSGRAIDLAFLGIAEPPEEWFRAGGALWKLMGGRWGGDFSTPDPGHFDG